MKKRHWTIAWEILFTYLAISKVLYWFELVAVAGDFTVDIVLSVLLPRFVFRDLPLIAIVFIFYFMDNFLLKLHEKQAAKRSKIAKEIALYAVGYVVVAAVWFAYSWLLIWVGWLDSGERLWGEEFLYMSSAYLLVVAVMVVKQFSAKKKKVVSKSAEDKVEMLEILLYDGVLTQEEFEIKKLRILE